MNITLKKTLSFLAVAFSLTPAFAQRDTVNVIDWQFSRSTLTPEMATRGDGSWKAVRLPHDFLVEQPWVAPAKDEKADNSDAAANVKSRLSARGFKEMGIGWYRRTFTPMLRGRVGE
jgi:beta-galactosidase